VAERAVENATFPVVADPGEGEVAIRAVNAGGGEIDRVGVECEEHTNPIPREGTELVELFGEAEGRCCMRNQGALWVLDVDRGFLHPGVAIKIAANEFAVVRPGVIAISGAVRTAKALALVDEIEEVGLLLVGKGQFTAGKEVDGVVVAKVGGGKQRDIFGVVDFKRAGLLR